MELFLIKQINTPWSVALILYIDSINNPFPYKGLTLGDIIEKIIYGS